MTLTADIFYDRKLRLWTVLMLDEEGNQTGDAEYAPSKELAQQYAKMWK